MNFYLTGFVEAILALVEGILLAVDVSPHTYHSAVALFRRTEVKLLVLVYLTAHHAIVAHNIILDN